MTITNATAMSLAKARGLRAHTGSLLVSILGAHEAQARRRPALAGWRSVLVLEFEDACENEIARSGPAGDWPLEPTQDEHAAILGAGRGRVPALSDARKIVQFVARHHASDEPLRLIVHCQAGVSRSVMVAHKVQHWLGLAEDSRVASCLPYANQRLARLLELARLEVPEANLGGAGDMQRRRKPAGP